MHKQEEKFGTFTQYDPKTGGYVVYEVKTELSIHDDALLEEDAFYEERDPVEIDERFAHYVKAYKAGYMRAKLAGDALVQTPRKIERAPGFALFGFLSTICSKKFVERELSALLADGNVQYQELLASGDTAGAWRWKWSMRIAMVSTVFRGGLGALLGLVKFKAQSSE
ncbi:hypothetical protein ACOYR4_15510 [Acidovorax sp. M14]|uniref:hypothetical protein n=1 Tax=Acidovorax sp. M14 TaxID=3411354 RepID=UPI003BF55FD1